MLTDMSKMKILQVIDSLNVGGAEKLLLDTIPLYREKGIEMDIVLLHDNNYPFTLALEKKKCCRIYKLSKGSLYNPLLIFKIAKILKGYGIAHVHLFPAQYWTVLANFINGNKTKLIFTEHNTSNSRQKNPFFAFIDKRIYRFYAKTVCITDEIKDILLKYTKLKDSDFSIINNGVDISHFIEAKPSSLKKDNGLISIEDKIITQVSGFRLQKDQETLIKSLQYLPKKFKVVLVGDGVYRTKCEDLVRKLNLSDRCLFLGKRTDVAEILKASDYIVLSSKYEGLSVSSIEGMASGKPFIASEVPGLKEIVKGYGVLFPKGDSKSLANKILELDNDVNLYNKIIEQCQKRANQFDIHIMVDKHIKLYEKLQN